MDLHTWLDAETGRASALADALGVSKTAVSLWRDAGVPLSHMPDIAKHTGGAVTVTEMAQHAVERKASRKPRKVAA